MPINTFPTTHSLSISFTRKVPNAWNRMLGTKASEAVISDSSSIAVFYPTANWRPLLALLGRSESLVIPP